jgi:hypothetical protein
VEVHVAAQLIGGISFAFLLGFPLFLTESSTAARVLA